jgi:hypothetical protein
MMPIIMWLLSLNQMILWPMKLFLALNKDRMMFQDVPEGDAVQGDVGGSTVQGDHQEAAVPRPRRAAKPNPKCSPDVYDLDYVKVRRRSRKSIRRVMK